MRDEYDALRLAYRLGITPEEAQRLPLTRDEALRRAYRSNTPISQSELDQYPTNERAALQQMRQANPQRGFPGEQQPAAPRQQGPRMSPMRNQPGMTPPGEPGPTARQITPAMRPGAAGRGFPGEQMPLASRMQAPRMSDASGQPAMPTRTPTPTPAASTPARAAASPVSREDALMAYRLGIPANELTAADRARYAEQQSRPGVLSRLFGRSESTTPAPAATRASAPAARANASAATDATATERPATRGPRQMSTAEREADLAAMREANEPAGRGRASAAASRPRPRPRPTAPRESESDRLNDISLALIRGQRPSGEEATNFARRMGIEGYKKGGMIGKKPAAKPLKKAAGGTVPKPKVPGRSAGRPATAVKPMGTRSMAKAAAPKKPVAMPAFKKGGKVTAKGKRK